MNLWMLLEHAARRHPDKTAVVDDGGPVTYAELARRAERIAAALAVRGLRRGDRTGILLRNSCAYVEAVFALLRLGAVCAPLNWRLTPAELRQQAAHADICCLLYEKEFRTAAPLDLVPCAGLALCIDEKNPSGATCRERLCGHAAGAGPAADTTPSDPAAIIQTAGTTGDPRAVVLTHGNFLWNTINYSHAYTMTPRDVELAPTPLFHASTFGRVFTYVFNRAAFVLCSAFEPEQCLELIARERVTGITQAPSMYRMMACSRHAGSCDTGSIRRAVSGASALSAQARQEMRALFPRASLYDIYGITEAGPGVSILGPDDFFAKPDSVGRPLLTVQVAVANLEGNLLPRGAQGEILVRGPNVMQGYYKDPDATTRALRGGWLHTGDLGIIDEGGHLCLLGRQKELIISGGMNVFPGEVDHALEQHPAVAEAAAFGMPDGLWGEQVAAAVVLQQGQSCTAGELAAFCRGRLAGYKCPKQFFFVPALPRSATQKVLRAELARAAGGAAQDGRNFSS